MLSRSLGPIVALAVLACPLQAATPEELDALHRVLGLDDLLKIVADEGIEQGEDLRKDMFPGQGGDGWSKIVSGIYATDRLAGVFRREFDRELADADVGPILDFYATDAGRKIRQVEVDARRAIMSDEVEAAAETAFETLKAEGGARLPLLETFVSINGLIDRNVTGAMNSSLAFYKGLEAGGGFEMGEEQMLREVWSQEPEIRADTEVWVYAYLTLAYEPLDDAELGDYVQLSSTESGQDLNSALFAGFYGVFDRVSYQLGRAASSYMIGEEL